MKNRNWLRYAVAAAAPVVLAVGLRFSVCGGADEHGVHEQALAYVYFEVNPAGAQVQSC